MRIISNISFLLFGGKIKGLKRPSKVVDCDEWHFEIHQRLFTFEEENKKLDQRLNEKDIKIKEI